MGTEIEKHDGTGPGELSGGARPNGSNAVGSDADRSNAVAFRSTGWNPWTASQRRALAAIFILSAIVLLIRAKLNPMIVADPPAGRGERFDRLADRLDPNVATAAELAAIPNFGPKRAAEVVSYRQAFLLRHPDRIAFASIEDLTNIKGVGPATLELLEEFLRFPPVQKAPNETMPSQTAPAQTTPAQTTPDR